MPSRNATFRCQCSRCCQVDLAGVPHNPAGKLIPISHKAAHLQRHQSNHSLSEQRLQSVRTLTEAELQPSTNVSNIDSMYPSALSPPLMVGGFQEASEASDIDSISARIFGLTLAADELDDMPQYSKLWSSREEFQQRANERQPQGMTVPSVHDLAASLANLTFQTPEAFSSSSMAVDTTSPPQSPAPCPSTLSGCHPIPDKALHHVPKGKHRRRATIAHSRLNGIETRMEIVSQSLATSTPSQSPQKIREEVTTLKLALESIHCREPSVYDRKKALATRVEEFLSSIEVCQSRVNELCKGPIIIDSG